MKTTALRTAPASTLCNLSCDVGMETINAAAPSLARPGFRAEWEFRNRSVEIREILTELIAAARHGGFDGLRVVVEPTGIYHRHFLRIARSLAARPTWSTPNTWPSSAASSSAMTARPIAATRSPSTPWSTPDG